MPAERRHTVRKVVPSTVRLRTGLTHPTRCVHPGAATGRKEGAASLSFSRLLTLFAAWFPCPGTLRVIGYIIPCRSAGLEGQSQVHLENRREKVPRPLES